MTDPNADQLAAAAADAARTFREAMSDHPDAIIKAIAGPPPWLLAFIERHNQLVMLPHLQCPHLGPGPAVSHIAVWAPGFVCCTTCADAGMLATQVPPGEQDRCDVCGTDSPDEMYGGRVRAGHVVIHFAVCPNCDPATVAGDGQ